MPLINISTSAKVVDKNKFLEEISDLLSNLTNKSKRFVMAKVDDDSNMFFDNDSPCCYIEIKSIGSLNPSKMVKPICNYLLENLGIPVDRIYVSFVDIPASMWGWNCQTFG